jgi:hypothetical protein
MELELATVELRTMALVSVAVMAQPYLELERQ